MILAAVAAVESFVSQYLPSVAETAGPEKAQRVIAGDLEARLSLEAKLASWPRLLFGRDLDRRDGRLIDFDRGRERRNALVHGTAALSGSAFDPSRNPPDADEAGRVLAGAERVIAAIFEMQGLWPEDALAATRGWTGLNR